MKGSVTRTCVLAGMGCLLAGSVLFPALPASAQERKVVGIMPEVTPEEYVERGVAAVEKWRADHQGKTASRGAALESVKALFKFYEDFGIEVKRIYPMDGLEWLLITDEVADSLTANLIPFLAEYSRNHEELLTQGRQHFEMELMKIVGPPPRMLGFHVVILGGFAVEKADSLLASGVTDDFDGLADGALRNIRDWCHQWDQVHTSELMIYQSRLVQQDWIISRLKDNCGVPGNWTIRQQYMAMVQADSSAGRMEDKFAHEFHLVSVDCNNEERVIMIDLPNFMDMQMEVMETTGSGKPGR